MDAKFNIFVTSKKIVTIWPPFDFVAQGDDVTFVNFSDDSIQIQGIDDLVEESVEPIDPGDDATYTVKNDASKGGHSFKVKVKMQASGRGEDVQTFGVTESDDPEIIIT